MWMSLGTRESKRRNEKLTERRWKVDYTSSILVVASINIINALH
jgi:hypothetical protein